MTVVRTTVCGLYVIPGREPQGWECGLYPVTLDTWDPVQALSLVRVEVMVEALSNGQLGASFVAASYHPGDAGKCPGLEYADQPVDANEERDRFGPRTRVYTVCGFYADTWQTYSTYVEAISPRMAYYQAWETVRDTEGRYLYVANVHDGVLERLPVPGTGQPPAFGDPTVQDPGEMEHRIKQLLGQE